MDGPIDLKQAHKHSSDHRAELERSALCGCFYCCALYPPDRIAVWTDKDESGLGQTAICPRCHVDSVLGDASGLPMTKEFLKQMKAHWFQVPPRS